MRIEDEYWRRMLTDRHISDGRGDEFYQNVLEELAYFDGILRIRVDPNCPRDRIYMMGDMAEGLDPKKLAVIHLEAPWWRRWLRGAVRWARGAGGTR